MCHPPLQRTILHFCYQRGLSQTLGYSGAIPGLAAGQSLGQDPDRVRLCYTPWLSLLAVCRDVWAPFLLHSCPGQCRQLDPALPPSTSVALTTSLRGQVWRTSSKASLAAVCSLLSPHAVGLTGWTGSAAAPKGCGHACGETLRNSAETGKKPPCSSGPEPALGRGSVPGEPGWRGPCRGPPSPQRAQTCSEPACAGWVVGDGEKRLQRLQSAAATGLDGGRAAARWGQSFLAPPVAPELPGRMGGSPPVA